MNPEMDYALSKSLEQDLMKIKRAVAAHSGQNCSLFRAASSARNFNLYGLLSTGMPTGGGSTEGDCRMKAKKLPSIDLVKSILNYNPETGIFTWKVDARGHKRKGKIAGSIYGDGYYILCINYKRYGAHRIAWLYHYGVAPVDEIDHINRIRSDCRITNLREVTRIQNANNRSMQRNNTSGIVGVNWNKVSEKWTASISRNGRSFHIGYFHSKEDATNARLRFD